MSFTVNHKLALLPLAILAAVSVFFFAVKESRSTSSAAPAAGPNPVQNLTPRDGTVAQEAFSSRIDNESWSVTSFENELGQWCAGETVTGAKVESSRRCIDPQTAFAKTPLVFSVGSRRLSENLPTWSQVWVLGWASPSVSKLELVISSCRTVPVRVNTDRRVFFHVLPARPRRVRSRADSPCRVRRERHDDCG